MPNDYLKVRELLLNAVKKELIGPGSEEIGSSPEEEIITESPESRYTIGMLFPQNMSAEEEVASEEGNIADSQAEEDNSPQEFISLANQYYPSAMGISFFTSGICPSLTIEVSAATYRKIKDDDDCSVVLDNLPESVRENKRFCERTRYLEGKVYVSGGFTEEERNYFLKLSEDRIYKSAIYKLYTRANYGWKRIPISEEKRKILIEESEGIRFDHEIEEGLKLVCIRRMDKKKNRTLFTVSLVNTFKSERQRDAEKTFFQVSCKAIFAKKEKFVFLEYDSESRFLNDPEFNSFRLLYSNRKEFATGHGCSAGWEIDKDNLASEVFTENMPVFEVPNIGFNVPEINKKASDVLVMNNLSDRSSLSRQEIIKGLERFCDVYKDWIDKLRMVVNNKVPQELRDAAQQHIKQCDEAFRRMEKGVDLLENNEEVFKVFQLANRAMFMQRVHSDVQKNKRFPEDSSFVKVDYNSILNQPEWRPFQLAFILLSIESISNSESPEREIVDLIWFSTAGGKTEAYLCITAFTIFLRRLKNYQVSGGTVVLMRYTLRLLASQQFQRAATLICACEIIRKEMESVLGGEKITIGLWVGTSLTPNSRKVAFDSLSLLIRGARQENPFQLFSCPWCGTKLVKDGMHGKWGYKEGRRPPRFIIYCTEKDCEFHDELPVKIVDEDIYDNAPTLLFGTVDKFALMPWKGEVSNIFALNVGNRNLSPELIIQDELHLIEGPLGTIVGLYETAVDILCSSKGIKPKIIASTATIRRAAEQCLALYRRKVHQFPPPGLYAEDSFFASEVPIQDKPGRLFVGIMSSGRTHTTTIIRFMASILQAVSDVVCEDKIKDAYWTFVGYYNTLRELGHNLTLVNDDVNDYLINMAKRVGVEYRRLQEPVELTSRIEATQIPEILERLVVGYPDKGAIQTLLATNMIATGVDIDRLALMMVAGQPKTTSEYIQATSRIGRKYPGLVFTIYNGTKPRDRSHFEHFRAYHQAFYKYVEPTTVTPFSGPARDRALHAVLVTLIRHLSGFNKHSEASQAIMQIPEDKLKRIKDQIIERVKDIDDRAFDKIAKDIDDIIGKWRKEAERNPSLLYGSLGNQEYVGAGTVNLLSPSEEYPGVWRTLTSMRDVDAECVIRIEKQ